MEEGTKQFEQHNSSPETMTPEARGEWERVHGHVDLLRKEHGAERADRTMFEQGLRRHTEQQQSVSNDNNVMFLILNEEGINPQENPTLVKLLEIAWHKGPVQASLVARKFKDPALLDRLHDALMNHYTELVKQGHFNL